MKSKATKRFWALYDALPNDVKRQATKAYLLWQKNPNAHGLRFKRVGKQMPVYSVRIGGGLPSAWPVERRYDDLVLDWKA